MALCYVLAGQKKGTKDDGTKKKRQESTEGEDKKLCAVLQKCFPW